MKSVIYGASTGYLDGWMAAGWKPEDLLLCYYGRLNRNNENKAKQELCLIPQGWPGFHPVQWFVCGWELLLVWGSLRVLGLLLSDGPRGGGRALGIHSPQPAGATGLAFLSLAPGSCPVSGDSAVSPRSVRGCGWGPGSETWGAPFRSAQSCSHCPPPPRPPGPRKRAQS